MPACNGLCRWCPPSRRSSPWSTTTLRSLRLCPRPWQSSVPRRRRRGLSRSRSVEYLEGPRVSPGAACQL
eukprot:11861635-Alexandrium_andersonii.AAC.1